MRYLKTGLQAEEAAWTVLAWNGDAVRAYGMIPHIHVCGKPEELVPLFCDEEGFEAWEVVQPENDIVGLQEKVGDRLAFFGCMDYQAKWITADTVVTEELLRQHIRDAIDVYGPGGNLSLTCFAFHPSITMELAAAMTDEALKYGTGYYCR